MSEAIALFDVNLGYAVDKMQRRAIICCDCNTVVMIFSILIVLDCFF